MQSFARTLFARSHSVSSLLAFLMSAGALCGQATNLPPGEPGKALNWGTQQDHRNMMEQLGIMRLRPGPSGQPGTTNSANYDPAKANPFPDLPDVLALKSGQKVTDAEVWWKQRRPEIIEDFEREVIGRVPKSVPKVSWTVVSNVTDGLVGKLPGNGKQVVGHVDNSAWPTLNVDIRMTVVTPVGARQPVPVLMMFGGFGGDGMPRPGDSPAPTNRFRRIRRPVQGPTVHRATARRRLGVCDDQPREHPGGQRSGTHQRHYRSGQQGPAP